MFTGIIETLATVEKIEKKGTNLDFTFSSSITHELKVDQSVSHNGICLTITGIRGNTYTASAIKETIEKTTIGGFQPSQLINIERCMPANGRFDGHIVQGHVDCTATCKSVTDLIGSFEFVFEHPVAPSFVTVEKGSITVNGVSLTVVKSTESSFSVHIIPYTFEHTSFKQIRAGDQVNLEFDIVGKYVARLLGKRA